MGSPGSYLSSAALLCQARKQRHQLASLALSYPCLKMILCRWFWKYGDLSSPTPIIVSEKWDFVRLRGERRWRLLLNKCPASAVGIDTSSSQLSPVITKWACVCHASFSRLSVLAEFEPGQDYRLFKVSKPEFIINPPTKPEPVVKGARLLQGFVKRIKVESILQKRTRETKEVRQTSWRSLICMGFSVPH